MAHRRNASDPGASAREAIAAATGPRSGALDTDQLGSWVADAARRDFATAALADALQRRAASRWPVLPPSRDRPRRTG